jgi:hypothetical protein
MNRGRITSNRGRDGSAVSKLELTAMIDLPSPLVWAFPAAAIAALHGGSCERRLLPVGRTTARSKVSVATALMATGKAIGVESAVIAISVCPNLPQPRASPHF